MNSTQKIMYILKRLGDYPYEFGVTELAHEMDCVKSGVFKIMSDLVNSDFAIQDFVTKKYSIGSSIYRLGCIYSEQKGIWNIAEKIVKELSSNVMETVSIGVMDGLDPMIAYKIESPNAVRLQGKLGAKFPIHAGAIGKLLGAYMDREEVLAILSSNPLSKKTYNTIVDSEELLNEFEKIRQQGYALSNEENSLGAYGIAVPICNVLGKVIACICIAGPLQRFTPIKIKEYILLLKVAAEKISYKLGVR